MSVEDLLMELNNAAKVLGNETQVRLFHPEEGVDLEITGGRFCFDEEIPYVVIYVEG